MNNPLVRLIAVVIVSITILVSCNSYEERNAFKTAASSVTRLLDPYGNGSGGTGFKIEYKGHQYTLTNDHVCGLAADKGYLVAVPTYGRVDIVRVLARSTTTDLCLLDGLSDMPALQLSHQDMKNFNNLYIVGHPLLDRLTLATGMLVRRETIQVLVGRIETSEQEAVCKAVPKYSVHEILFFGKFCVATIKAQKTTARIYPGNSGSPVLGSGGMVYGIAFASSDRGRPSFIVPVSDIWHFLRVYNGKALKSASMPKVRRGPRPLPRLPSRP